MKKITLLCALFLALISSSTYALTQTVTATVHFVTPVTITNVVNADFGNVRTGTATSYTVDTTGNVTTTTGAMLSGSKQAASMLIKGSDSQTINISVGSYLANGGVTPSSATCKYGTGVASDCTDTSFATAPAPKVTGTPLLVGVTISTDGTQTDNTTVNPTFTVTVIYN